MRSRTLVVVVVLPLLAGLVLIAGLAFAATGADDGTVDRRGDSTPATTTKTRSDVPDNGPNKGTGANDAVPENGSEPDPLHEDSNMTQQMSDPDADGPMFSGDAPNPQLDRSRDPGYLRELERHQQDLDRSLARGNSRPGG